MGWQRFEAWRTGRTGVPFVDANMRELLVTGYMSNRGRQNVASFLVHDLGLPWTLGAEHFESHLVDHEPASNYGNWQYLAGVGNDPREDRVFNVIKQAGDYDAEADFVKTWCPELARFPKPYVQTPWLAPLDVQRQSGCIITTSYEAQAAGGPDGCATYPRPLVESPAWKKYYSGSGGGAPRSQPRRGRGKKRR